MQIVTSEEHREKTKAQSLRQHGLWWSAESTAVVIIPKGLVSYHPVRGFEGEATAILSYGMQSKHTDLEHDHATDLAEKWSSANGDTFVMQTHSSEHKSETDREPVAGYSFRWLAIALVAGCLLFLARYYYNRRNE